MTLASMTGFARVDGTHGGVQWTWEIRSVNGRNLDIRVRLPNGHDDLDPGVRALIREKLTRGNVNVSLTLTRGAQDTTIRLNEPLFETVLAIAERYAGRAGTSAPALDGLLSMKGVLEMAEPEASDAEKDALNAALMAGCESVLDQLVSVRRKEGAALADAMTSHVSAIERLTASAESSPDRTAEAIKGRLRQQVEALMDTGAEFDPQRLHQEAVLLASKADIREELDRLTAHVAAARALLADGAVVGRKLDFLAQEFNREVNTLCSKSHSVELTAIGLDMKAVVEQLREQIQNIE